LLAPHKQLNAVVGWPAFRCAFLLPPHTESDEVVGGPTQSVDHAVLLAPRARLHAVVEWPTFGCAFVSNAVKATEATPVHGPV
jgi:hypothetical protein